MELYFNFNSFYTKNHIQKQQKSENKINTNPKNAASLHYLHIYGENLRNSIIFTSNKKVSDQYKKKIIELYRLGMSSTKIAPLVNCSESNVRYIIRKHPNYDEISKEHARNKRNISQEREKEVIELYRKGKRIQDIALELSCSAKTISDTIRQNPDYPKLQKEHNQKLDRGATTEEQNKEIIELYRKGKSMALIADFNFVSESVVRRIIRQNPNSKEIRLEHFKNSQSFSQQEINRIKNRYKKTKSLGQTAKTFNSTKDTIKRVLTCNMDNEIEAIFKQRDIKITYEYEDRVLELYMAGYTIENIAKSLGFSAYAIRNIIDSQEDYHKQTNS